MTSEYQTPPVECPAVPEGWVYAGPGPIQLPKEFRTGRSYSEIERSCAWLYTITTSRHYYTKQSNWMPNGGGMDPKAIYILRLGSTIHRSWEEQMEINNPSRKAPDYDF